MKALIMIAHGSRRQIANDQFIELVKSIKKQAHGQYFFVEHTFLEFSFPSLADTVHYVAMHGATDIDVFPYFLNSGNHVTRDIPAMIQQVKQTHSQCRFRILPSLGTIEGLDQWVFQQIKRISASTENSMMAF